MLHNYYKHSAKNSKQNTAKLHCTIRTIKTYNDKHQYETINNITLNVKLSKVMSFKKKCFETGFKNIKVGDNPQMNG